MRDFDKILKIVIEAECVSLADIKSPSRKREIKEARQIVMYLVLKYTNRTLQQVADEFEQTHANVIHAQKYIQELMDTDSIMLARVERCERLINLDSKIVQIERAIADMSDELAKELQLLVSQYNTKISNILKRA